MKQLFMRVIVVFMFASLSFSAFALDIYVDTKTKQLFAEPGPGRARLGTLNIENSPAAASQENNTADNQQPKPAETKIVEENSPADSNARITQGSDGAFRFETKDGNFNFRLGGRINADASFSHDDNFLDAAGNKIEANDGTEIRRGRLKFEGTFYKDWFFKSEVDFADNDVSIKDMFMQYYGLGFVRIRVGEQKQAFSRELQESANDLLFIERSVMNALNEPTADRALGVNFFAHGQSILGLGQNWTGQVGIYGDTIAANKRNTFADEGWGVSSRMTFAPIAAQGSVIHIGVAGNYREPNDADEVNDRPLVLATESTHMSNLNLVRANIAGVNNIKMLGIEGHGLMGPFSLGGEYTHSWIDLKGGVPSHYFSGWYAETAWTLTGEPRNYRKGVFHRVIPDHAFSLAKGGLGAWELAARYAEVDLNDGVFKGGQQSNLTVALNWYPNQILRLMAGYDKALKITDSPLTNRDGSKVDNLDTFMFRAQMAF